MKVACKVSLPTTNNTFWTMLRGEKCNNAFYSGDKVLGLNENRLIETLIRAILNKYITHRQKHRDTLTEVYSFG